jgi:hypothetical protein
MDSVLISPFVLKAQDDDVITLSEPKQSVLKNGDGNCKLPAKYISASF